MSRKTITIREDVFDRLDADRGDTESWSDFLDRLADEDGDTEHEPNTATVENVDEIARAVAAEVENRMTRR